MLRRKKPSIQDLRLCEKIHVFFLRMRKKTNETLKQQWQAFTSPRPPTLCNDIRGPNGQRRRRSVTAQFAPVSVINHYQAAARQGWDTHGLKQVPARSRNQLQSLGANANDPLCFSFKDDIRKLTHCQADQCNRLEAKNRHPESAVYPMHIALTVDNRCSQSKEC